MPFAKSEKDQGFIRNCRVIKATFNPDVVHIHGTEYLESLLWVHANGVEHTVVSLQGIMKACCQYYYSGMSQWDVLSSITPRDLYRGTIFSKAHDFQCKAQYEQQLLQQVKHVIGRTTWDKTLLWSMNPNVEYHLIMRFSGKNSMTILFGDIQNVKSIVYLLAKPVYHIKGYINW